MVQTCFTGFGCEYPDLLDDANFSKSVKQWSYYVETVIPVYFGSMSGLFKVYVSFLEGGGLGGVRQGGVG